MAREDVTRILGKYFVDVKIDIDRTIGGQDLMKHYTKGQPNGIPWFAVVDAKGEVLVTSNYPTNNLGFPYQPEEIEAFGQMLAKGSIRITDKDIAALKESLAEARQEIERRRSGSR